MTTTFPFLWSKLVFICDSLLLPTSAWRESTINQIAMLIGKFRDHVLSYDFAQFPRLRSEHHSITEFPNAFNLYLDQILVLEKDWWLHEKTDSTWSSCHDQRAFL